MKRFPLRIRLTLLMALVCGVALSVTAVIGLSRIEESLREDTRSNAEALLSGYFDQVLGGSVGPASPAPEEATQFLYLDEDGNDLTAAGYQRLLAEALEESLLLGPMIGPEGLLPDVVGVDQSPILIEAGSVEVIFEPVSLIGDPELLDRGPDVIAVGSPARIGDEVLTIAVSSPLLPVNSSVDTLRRLLTLLVPALTAALAAATWIIVGRALRPVDAISAQVDRITTESLDQRVPEPGNDDEIGHLARTMNQMLARLEDARDTQRQFISDASHELRSPITAAQATLEVARDYPERTDWSATTDVLLQENVRLASLVDDLLLLARLDETSASMERTDVDLDELCLAEAERPHPVPIDVRVISPARVHGELGRLTRALRNLIDNAARHAETAVTIEVRGSDGTATVVVSDDGPGIADEHLETVFDRFSRIDSSRNREAGGGAGLGLAITRQILLANGGTVTARRAPDGGAEFTVRLPLSQTPQSS